MLEDFELLGRYVRDRDQIAFAELVRRHLNQVHASALRRVGYDVHLAADVTQGVFIALAQQARWLIRHPTLVGWLHTTTRNQAANIVRSEKRRKAREAETLLMNQPDTSIDALDWKIAGPALESALDALSERDRAALLLRFADGKSFAAIGQLTDATEDAARMRVDRALQKLRTHLARRGIVSTAALLGGALATQAAVEAPRQIALNISQSVITSTSASIPSAATIMNFMTTTKFAANLTAAALVILAAGTAAYETQAAGRTKSELLALRSETNRLERSINELNEKSNAAVLAAARAPIAAKSPAETDAAKADQASQSARSSAPVDPTAAGKAFLQRHPEARAAFEAYVRNQMTAQFEAFWKSLNFTPAEIEEFVRLMGASSSVGMDMGKENGGYMVFELDPDLTQRQRWDRFASFMGKDRMKAFYEYNRTMPARDVVATLSGSLTFSSQPLSAEQTSSLIALVRKNYSPLLKSGPQEIDWNSLLAAANGVLNADQLAMLGNIQKSAEYSVKSFSIAGKPVSK